MPWTNEQRQQWKEEHPNYNRAYYDTHRKEIRRNARRRYKKNRHVVLKSRKDAYWNGQRERVLDTQRRNNREKRMEVLLHYGGNPPKCACCGESAFEFLVLDHISGGGNQHRKSLFGRAGAGSRMIRWIIKEEFPEGFRVLCHNCNMALAMYGRCPHTADS